MWYIFHKWIWLHCAFLTVLLSMTGRAINRINKQVEFQETIIETIIFNQNLFSDLTNFYNMDGSEPSSVATQSRDSSLQG